MTRRKKIMSPDAEFRAIMKQLEDSKHQQLTADEEARNITINICLLTFLMLLMHANRDTLNPMIVKHQAQTRVYLAQLRDEGWY